MQNLFLSYDMTDYAFMPTLQSINWDLSNEIIF